MQPTPQLPDALAPTFRLVKVQFEARSKLAVTVFASSILTVQVVLLPVQAPDQPIKVEPDSGAAVNVTLLLTAKLAEQLDPQLMPVGELVTVPVPVPVLLTVSCLGTRLKLAVTLLAAVILTVQVSLLPVQAPDQPSKTDPILLVAVKVTLVLFVKLAEQVEPQLMPLGLLVTVPLPKPDLDTLSKGFVFPPVRCTILTDRSSIPL